MLTCQNKRFHELYRKTATHVKDEYFGGSSEATLSVNCDQSQKEKQLRIDIGTKVITKAINRLKER
jgi:hypothetical protein